MILDAAHWSSVKEVPEPRFISCIALFHASEREINDVAMACKYSIGADASLAAVRWQGCSLR
jgi:hypothetical protein